MIKIETIGPGEQTLKKKLQNVKGKGKGPTEFSFKPKRPS